MTHSAPCSSNRAPLPLTGTLAAAGVVAVFSVELWIKNVLVCSTRPETDPFMSPKIADTAQKCLHAHGPSGMLTLLQDHDRVVLAYVLELGIVLHSFVIGVNLGVSSEAQPAAQTGLCVALCFHQLFEGIGLGASLAQARLPRRRVLAMISAFALTTPMGVAIGIGISTAYDGESTTASVVRGVFNALSAGILIYLALVDLMAAEFARADLTVALQGQMVGMMVMGGACMTALAVWA
jgi:zinc transporter 1/2/3